MIISLSKDPSVGYTSSSAFHFPIGSFREIQRAIFNQTTAIVGFRTWVLCEQGEAPKQIDLGNIGLVRLVGIGLLRPTSRSQLHYHQTVLPCLELDLGNIGLRLVRLVGIGLLGPTSRSQLHYHQAELPVQNQIQIQAIQA